MTLLLRGRKSIRFALALVLVLDTYILAALVVKLSTEGMSGFVAWIRHLHYVPVPSVSGQPTYQVQSDYRFTALVLVFVLSACAATFVVMRSYMNARRNRE